MNTENTDIKVEKESDDEVESEIELYADHEIKEEMVIGPVVLQRVVNATNYCEDVPAPKKPRLEGKDEKTEQVEPHQKEIIEDNTVEILSNVKKKKRNEVENKGQTKCYNPTPGISDDEVESDLDLYADHEIKEEIVIGPVVLQRVVNAMNYCKDVPAPKKPRLEVKDEKTEQVEPHQKEIIEDNTVEIVSNVKKKKRNEVGNKEQTKWYNPTPGISDDEVESDLDLYADHEIKEEIVIGLVVLQRVLNATNYCEDVPAPKKPRLEGKDEKTEQVEPHQKEIIEDNTVEIVSNVIKKKRKKVGNKEQTKCNALRTYNPPGITPHDCDVPAPKMTRLERNEKKTYQVKSQKEMKKNNTQEIKSSVQIKKKQKKVKNQEHTKSYNLRKYNQIPGISQNVFICNDCGKQYRKKCELAQHIVSHDKIKQDNNYKCKECTYQTGSQESLEKHYKLHDINRSFICDLCGYKSDKKHKLLKHLKSKHSLLNEESKEKASLCSVCGYKCKQKSVLLIHLRIHTGEKPYSCSECEFKCKSKSNLTAHLRIHTKSYSCSECEFKCRSKPKLKRHLYIHTKPYACSECEYKGTSKSNLTAHLRIHRKPYSCSECKYKSSTKKDLTRHFRTHTGEKPYSCSECEYKCAYKSSLRTHIHNHTSAIHIGEKPYSCSTCKHKFAKKGNLMTHLRTHTGEKAYSCSKCEFKCKSRLGLISHFYIHTGEKPYSCSECDYKCVTKSRLTTHLRIHNGEKPYSCSKCDYKCAHLSSLRAHLRIHKGEKPYSCSECGYKCASKRNLTEHLRTSHTGKKTLN